MFNTKAGISHVFKYEADDVYQATIKAIVNSDSFNLKDGNAKTRIITISSKMSLVSWGEYIELNINPSIYGSEVTIQSQSKWAATDFGKNQKNIAQLLNAIEIEAEKIAQDNLSKQENNTIDEIVRLFEMKEQGIITEDEFVAMKRKLI